MKNAESPNSALGFFAFCIPHLEEGQNLPE
jgi:hypothetical protein